ncbi:hypothetical protein AB0950_37770 [Streptomyces sp. NPDC007189]
MSGAPAATGLGHADAVRSLLGAGPHLSMVGVIGTTLVALLR